MTCQPAENAATTAAREKETDSLALRCADRYNASMISEMARKVLNNKELDRLIAIKSDPEWRPRQIDEISSNLGVRAGNYGQTFSVYLPQKVIDRLDELCAKYNVSRSKYIRAVMEVHLD